MVGSKSTEIADQILALTDDTDRYLATSAFLLAAYNKYGEQFVTACPAVHKLPIVVPPEAHNEVVANASPDGRGHYTEFRKSARNVKVFDYPAYACYFIKENGNPITWRVGYELLQKEEDREFWLPNQVK